MPIAFMNSRELKLHNTSEMSNVIMSYYICQMAWNDDAGIRLNLPHVIGTLLREVLPLRFYFIGWSIKTLTVVSAYEYEYEYE